MAFKLRTRTQFPANVSVTSPLTVQKTGLMYLFGLSITALRQTLDAIYQPIGAVSTDPTYYAQDYGVFGNGGTYTTQMQNLLDVVKAAGGGKIVLPRGSFSCGAVTYSTAVAVVSLTQGIQIEGQGQEATTIVFTGTSSFLFTQSATTGTAWQAGVTFKKFKISAAGVGSGGISIFRAAYVNIEDMRILVQGTGIYNTASGDPDSTFNGNIKRVRFDNCGKVAGTFGLDIFPGGTAVEISSWRIENCQFEANGVAGAVANPPTSGAMRWRGLICQIVNCAFTANNNVALYVAKSGSPSNLIIEGTSFENTTSTVHPHIFVDSSIRQMKISNSEILNNDSFVCQGGYWFDSTSGVQGNITIDSIKVRVSTGNNPFVAFRQLGTAGNWMADFNRIRNVNWQLFDGTGQTRFSGWKFDTVPGQCALTVSALGTVKLAPTGYGNTMPLKLKATGEWIAYQVPTAGITASGLTGLSANTPYFFFLQDAGLTSPTGSVVLSALSPTMDTNHGYNVGNTQSEILFLGSFTTNSSGDITINSPGYSWYPAGAALLTPWTVYTPVVTAGSGTPTTVTATGRFKRTGNTVQVQAKVTITAIGTAAGNVVISLPMVPAAFDFAGIVFESGVTGKSGAGFIPASTATLLTKDAAAAVWWVNGYVLVVTATYEVP